MNNPPKKKSKGLTFQFVNSVSQPGSYHDGKGLGLFLLVKPNGSRFWVQRITVQGKRRDLGLGSPPVVTLANARDAALENKRLVRAGLDPLTEKRKRKKLLSFEQAARLAHVEIAPTYKNPKDGKAFLSTLETYMFPRFGDIALTDVTSADIRQAILAAREKAPGIARKLVHRTSAVFRWGIAEGHCVANPSVAQALALPRDTRKTRNRKALPYAEVATCIEVLKASGAWTSTKLAIEFLILTASRSGEARLARWDEVDLENAVWTIPADRMKMGLEHRVPLSIRALEILSEAEGLKDSSGLIFPSIRGKPLSDMTLSKLVKEQGFDVDVHGFRTSFRTWAQEKTNAPREVAEAALAHKVGDIVERSYARSDVFDKRRALMDRWASYLSETETKVLKMI